MPAIIRPEKWQERPRGTLILDQGHWAFGAIVHALCPGQALVDLKTGIAPTKVDAAEIVGTPEGPAINGGSIYRYYEFADSPQNSNSRMMVVARWSGTGATNEGPASKRVVFGQGWNLAGSFNALLGANYPAFGFFDGSGWRTASGTEDIRSAGLVTLAGGYDGNVVTLSAKGRTYTTAFSGSIPDVAVSVKIGGDGGDVVSGGTTSLFYLIDGNRLRSSTCAVEELAKAPWQVFRKQARILYFPSAGGGGAITGTGSPAAQSATVSGTATRTVTGSGTPAAQAATVSGTAEREITSSGTPAAQSATVSGTGTVGAVVTGSGAPQAQSATVAGTAEREVTASGTVAAQSATVSGTAEREITSSGTPTAQSATVVGTGQVGNIISGSGTPTAQSATVSGTAEREITASGAVAASSATVAGTAERTITGTGTLSASSATVYGFDSAPADTGVRRIYPAGGARIDREIDGWLKNQEEKSRLALIAREDEEILMVMLALAA